MSKYYYGHSGFTALDSHTIVGSYGLYNGGSQFMETGTNRAHLTARCWQKERFMIPAYDQDNPDTVQGYLVSGVKLSSPIKILRPYLSISLYGTTYGGTGGDNGSQMYYPQIFLSREEPMAIQDNQKPDVSYVASAIYTNGYRYAPTKRIVVGNSVTTNYEYVTTYGYCELNGGPIKVNLNNYLGEELWLTISFPRQDEIDCYIRVHDLSLSST